MGATIAQKFRSALLITFVAIGIYSSFSFLLRAFESGHTNKSTDPDPQSAQSHVKTQLYASEQGYQRYVQKRKQKVGTDPDQVNPWPPAGGYIYYYDYFLPAFNCPHTNQRIGRIGDGGKWTCGFDLFEKSDDFNSKEKSDEPCIVYSFGIAHESSFEAEFLERTNCEIYGYDASVNGFGSQVSASETRAHFQKMFIGRENTANTKTLGTIMRENGHTWIDFLKMDIEQKEYVVLEQIMNEFEVLPFGQLHIEIHGDNNGTYFPKFYQLWERMEEWGLRAFFNEVNHYACVVKRWNPFLMEYSFINIRGDHRILRNPWPKARAELLPGWGM